MGLNRVEGFDNGAVELLTEQLTNEERQYDASRLLASKSQRHLAN